VAITGLDGKQIQDPNGHAVTLSDVCVNALLGVTADEARTPTSEIEKLRRFNLAQKIFEKPDVVLSSDELQLIRDRVGAYHGTLIVGEVAKLLDGVH
jgi:hypothetical protein